MVSGQVMFMNDEQMFCDGSPCERTVVTWLLLLCELVRGVLNDKDIVRNNGEGKGGREV